MITFGHISLTDKYPNQTPKIKVSGIFSSSPAMGQSPNIHEFISLIEFFIAQALGIRQSN